MKKICFRWITGCVDWCKQMLKKYSGDALKDVCKIETGDASYALAGKLFVLEPMVSCLLEKTSHLAAVPFVERKISEFWFWCRHLFCESLSGNKNNKRTSTDHFSSRQCALSYISFNNQLFKHSQNRINAPPAVLGRWDLASSNFSLFLNVKNKLRWH